MNHIRSWYAVYTRPRWEKKTALKLAELQIETYCPLQSVVRKWADRKKLIQIPLFTSYCFVRVNSKEASIVRQTSGVVNFVHWLGEPAIIRDDEITLIKRFLSDHSVVRIKNIDAQVSDNVRIISGALTCQEGTISEVKNGTVKVLLPTLGLAIFAEVEKNNIELI